MVRPKKRVYKSTVYAQNPFKNNLKKISDDSLISGFINESNESPNFINIENFVKNEPNSFVGDSRNDRFDGCVKEVKPLKKYIQNKTYDGYRVEDLITDRSPKNKKAVLLG